MGKRPNVRPSRYARRSASSVDGATVELGPDGTASAIRLFAFGINNSEKGPVILTLADAAEVQAAFDARGTKLTFDYDHAVVRGPVGGPILCAGNAQIETRGDGLWATQIAWTARSSALILAKEILYYSPFFDIEQRADGDHVVNIINVGLTSVPAMHGLSELALSTTSDTTKRRAWLSLAGTPTHGPTTPKGGRKTMIDPDTHSFLTDLAGMIGKFLVQSTAPVETDEPDGGGDGAAEEASAVPPKKGPPPPAAPAAGDEEAPPPKKPMAASRTARGSLARAFGAVDDEAAAVELAQLMEAAEEVPQMRKQLSALQTSHRNTAWDALMKEGVRAGKVAPGQRETLAETYEKNPAKLAKFLSTAPAIVRPAARTDEERETAVTGATKVALSAADRRVIAQSGVSEEKYLAQKQRMLSAGQLRGPSLSTHDVEEEELAMSALSANKPTDKYGANQTLPQRLSIPVKASVHIYSGAAVVISGGYAAPASTATSLISAGVAEFEADNSSGSNAALSVDVNQGVFGFDNSASTDQILATDVGATAYWVDDHTVAKTSASSTRSAAGTIYGLTADGQVLVLVRLPG